MLKNPFSLFEQAEAGQERQELATRIRQEGHSCFRRFIDSFTAAIKAAQDGELERIEQLIAQAQELFPVPAEFSPSWQKIWDELLEMSANKRSVLEEISAAERDGEWQIIIDNPKAIQEVVCYPGLPFLDAANLYAYFRPQLAQNEYIRLQKIQTVIQKIGP
ncbi:hypothetical protein B5M42_014910 [Paenibacillus athensensis]|uniref:Uncharacterized protein n=1 Tax=Paenibacillus athensensis TaxID=1967502 RepID=A0A4Y8Q932_9BACL|nr:hypothetical protein [Paenibacillus athensensis]MCD1260103.1 hypothetical protein [Paenibacillus athensensis]